MMIFAKLAEWQCIGWLHCQAGGNGAKFKLAGIFIHNSVASFIKSKWMHKRDYPIGCVNSRIWLKINKERKTTIRPSVIADYGDLKFGQIPYFGRIPRANFIRALSRRMGRRATDVASHMEKSFLIRHPNASYSFLSGKRRGNLFGVSTIPYPGSHSAQLYELIAHVGQIMKKLDADQCRQANKRIQYTKNANCKSAVSGRMIIDKGNHELQIGSEIGLHSRTKVL